MSLYAQVEIWNPELDIRLATIPEPTASEKEAAEQFSNLGKLIASLRSPQETIVLETVAGYMIFPQKFLVDCLLRLKVETHEEEVE